MKTKIHQQGVTSLIVIGIFALVVFAVVVFVVGSRGDSERPKEQSMVEQPLPKTETSPKKKTEAETDQWKSFSISELSFRYPTDWFIEQRGAEAVRLANFKPLLFNPPLSDGEIVVNVFIDRNPDPEEVKETFNCPNTSTSQLLSCTDVVINGRTYKKMLHQIEFGTPLKVLTIAAQEGGAVYMGVGSAPDGAKQQASLSKVEEIFSTFVIGQ